MKDYSNLVFIAYSSLFLAALHHILICIYILDIKMEVKKLCKCEQGQNMMYKY